MITSLDHVGLSIGDVLAAAAYALLFGAEPTNGPTGGPTPETGSSARFQLANMALLIRPGGAEPVFSLGFAVDDLLTTERMLDRRGVPTDEGVLSRPACHGVAINLAARRPADPPPRGRGAAHALDHIVIHTPNPERAVALYGGRLGLDLRLDRTNPQWGTRLLFFRLADAVIEVSADLKAPIGDGPDRITGLAWRVEDAVAAQARLADGGLNVSPVRPGRKPGTQVFTVRSGLPGAPALMLSGAER
jgi:catechol 2,3-dioxygenase-like lactoylglutathione lyase family enzyme